MCGARYYVYVMHIYICIQEFRRRERREGRARSFLTGGCIVYGCTMYGVRQAVHGIRCAVYSARCTVCGARCTVCGARYYVYVMHIYNCIQEFLRMGRRENRAQSFLTGGCMVYGCTMYGVRQAVHGIRCAVYSKQ